MTRLTLPPDFCRRVLGLPADTRATLAAVPGPGWHVVQAVGTYDRPTADPAAKAAGTEPPWPGALTAWWPANPAAAVCAVCGVLPHAAHQLIADACPGLDEDDDDHSAALDVVEAHLRERP